MNIQHTMAGLVVGLILGVGLTATAQDEKNALGEVVMSEGLAATRQAPDGDTQVGILAEGKEAFLGKLRVRPNGSIKKHSDPSEQYLYILRGSGTLTIDGTEYGVEPKMTIFVEPGAEMSFQNDDGLFEALQVYAPPEAANKYSKWETGVSPFKPQPTRGESQGSGSSGGGSVSF
jgi:quercetin dioxygenase-like cupin family protein